VKNLSKFLAAAQVRYNFHGIVVEGGADKFGEYATSVSQDLHRQGKCEIEILQVLLRYAEKEKEGKIIRYFCSIINERFSYSGRSLLSPDLAGSSRKDA
jgi:hypothetical protein